PPNHNRELHTEPKARRLHHYTGLDPSWIPPVSIFAAPLSYAAGDFTALQLAGSLALAAVATVAVVWVAARIYRRTILNNGQTTKWSQALRG
ncbi:hypothetical protein QP951_10330, partial [Corynebacterium appendicis]|nr:hypothetical protein [Corynebacterium appendicis]